MHRDIWARLLASKTRRTDGLEAWSGFVTFAWGAVLALPGDTFSTTRSYDTLASIGGERFWIAVCWTIAVVQISGLASSWLLGGRELRILGACCAALFWTALGVMLCLSNPIGHGWVLYASLGLCMVLTAASLHADRVK